jgi:predicted DNA-binding transcriptional regulator AlpA
MALTPSPEFEMVPTRLLIAEEHITRTTLSRWQRDPRLEFLAPIRLATGRKAWRRSDLLAWKEKMFRKSIELGAYRPVRNSCQREGEQSIEQARELRSGDRRGC